jgi:hypothetical protein
MIPTIVPTVPLPPASTWGEFPVISVIVLCFALAFVSIFFAIRWVWGAYCKEREKDLAWRAEQNKQREQAAAEQNKLWREAVAERDARYEIYDRERQGTLKELADTMAGMVKQLTDHDEQAKEIKQIVQRVDVNTQRRPRQQP